MLLEETTGDPIRLFPGVVMSTQQQVQARIEFLQTQLDSLDHYLPETYQLLIKELDCQQRDLMELKIQDFYQSQENEYSDPSPPAGHPE